MQDRQPGAPGQYKATLSAAEFQKMQAGEQFTITMVRDDQPIVEGTPYSKAAVLPDELAAIICPDVLNPSPADALRALLPRNGNAPMSANLSMGGHRVTGLGEPEADGDAVPLGYVREDFFPNTGGTLTGGLDVNGGLASVYGTEYDANFVANGKNGYNRLFLTNPDTVPAITDIAMLMKHSADGDFFYKLYGEHNKPTADAIGAAPAGYGLGGNSTPISWADVDNVKRNGWYLVASATPITINGISFSYALLESKTFDANAGKQVLHPLFLNGVVLDRYCEGNVWGIWKSPNPQMYTGVEYATTEMLNGATIYKKRDSNGNVLYRAEGSSTWRNYAALVGAAPRGFGLGGDCVTITTLAELDATITNGWYNVKLSEPLVVSGVSISYAYMHVKGYDANWVEQEIHPMISDFTSKLVRKRHNGASWRELEWDNPPMMEGVEYRTTKRHNGKAIYTKMFTFAPSSITALNYDIPHSISNLDIGLSISVSWARGADQQRHLPSAYSENAAWNGQVFWNSNWALHFELGSALQDAMESGGRNVAVTLEYTKSTN